MKIIDISWALSDVSVEYKDKKTIEFEKVKKYEKDDVRGTRIRLASHSGTHIDAPAHFLKSGKSIDQVKLDSCVGECIVLDMTHVGERITCEDLEKQEIKKDDIVLLKTTNSALSSTGTFNHGFVFLDASGARYLADMKIKAVGIDYLGIERGQQGHPTHTLLFENNVTIIEGLRLKTVNPGAYFFCCLPINIIGPEAAPARAVLIEG